MTENENKSLGTMTVSDYLTYNSVPQVIFVWIISLDNHDQTTNNSVLCDVCIHVHSSEVGGGDAGVLWRRNDRNKDRSRGAKRVRSVVGHLNLKYNQYYCLKY